MKNKVACFRINKNTCKELDFLWLDLLDMFKGNRVKMQVITKANIVESMLALMIEDFKFRGKKSFIFLRIDFKLKTFIPERHEGESSNKLLNKTNRYRNT